MTHLRKTGISILIDIPITDIYKRLQRMKVERIVGMGKMTLEEILQERRYFYSISYDFVFLTNFSKEKTEVIKDFLEFYKKFIIKNIIKFMLNNFILDFDFAGNKKAFNVSAIINPEKIEELKGETNIEIITKKFLFY